MEVRSKYLKTFRYMQTIVGSEDSSVLGNVDAYLLCFQGFQHVNFMEVVPSTLHSGNAKTLMKRMRRSVSELALSCSYCRKCSTATIGNMQSEQKALYCALDCGRKKGIPCMSVVPSVKVTINHDLDLARSD